MACGKNQNELIWWQFPGGRVVGGAGGTLCRLLVDAWPCCIFHDGAQGAVAEEVKVLGRSGSEKSGGNGVVSVQGGVTGVLRAMRMG